MTLQPAQTLGLWRDPDVPVGAPGVHAVIVGVSDYPHLDLGRGPKAAQTGAMGQLAVSASGAAQVFDWLRGQETFADRPVVSCRLLLAPGTTTPTRGGPTEADFVAAITGGHHEAPTFRNLRDAIEAWATEMIQPPRDRRDENGALFFFSGHGLEVLSSPSLLAQDILNPTALGQGANLAIAYKRVLEALPTYGFGDAMFFFDACRNAPDVAQRLNIVGQGILDPAPNPADAPRSMMFLKAAAANTRSYQDPDGDRRASLFTHALIEALEGVGDDANPYDRSTTPWLLKFQALEGYTKRRVRELLAEKDAIKVQTVTAGGDPTDGEVTVARRHPIGAMAAPAGVMPQDIALAAIAPADAMAAEAAPTMKAVAQSVEAESDLVKARFDVRLGGDVEPRAGGSANLLDFGFMHQVLGNENRTIPWIDLLTITTLDGAPVDPKAVRVLDGKTSTKDNLTWLDVEVTPGPPNQALWLAFNAGRWSGPEATKPMSYAALLPRDTRHPMPVRLEIGWVAVEDFWQLRPDYLSARLGPPVKGPGASQRIWGPLWEAQRTAVLANADAASQLLMNAPEYEAALRNKVESPLAAAIGAARLLAAGALDNLRDWPRNLAELYPTYAEGPVLWAETLLRLRARERKETGGQLSFDEPRVLEAAQHFARLAKIGPPLIGPVLESAVTLAQTWGPLVEAENAPQGLREAVALVLEAASRAEADDIFLTFSSTDETFAPEPAFRRPV